MRRATLAVGLLVVMAGCNAPFGATDAPPGTGSPTPTATATPGATATPPPAPGDVGLAADGVVEPLKLRRAHIAALDGESYTLVRTVTVRRPNGSTLVGERRRFATDRWQDRFVWNFTRRVAPDAPSWVRDGFGDSEVERAYSNASVTVIEAGEDLDDLRVRRAGEGPDNESVYPLAYRDVTGRGFVFNTFLQVDTRVTEIERTGGTVRYRLAAAEGRQDLRFTRGSLEVEGRVVSLSAVVDRSGLVRAVDLRYVLSHEGERVVVRETLRITDVGETTVARPAWVDDLDE